MKLKDINETMFQALSPEVQLAIVNQPSYEWIAMVPAIIMVIAFAIWILR